MLVCNEIMHTHIHRRHTHTHTLTIYAMFSFQILLGPPSKFPSQLHVLFLFFKSSPLCPINTAYMFIDVEAPNETWVTYHRPHTQRLICPLPETTSF